ncbi:twin-arginine translocase TatA/TatE family subunit [Kamptonema cortianum]|nr:twin-arginine translocase TatA/TatE family subunit [Kamptonema cortianum]
MPILNSLALGIQGYEWLIIALIILILFGGAKIPQLMRGVGRGMGELQKGLKEGKDAMDSAMKAPDDETDNSSSK